MGALEFLASYSGAHLFGRAASQKLLTIGALFGAGSSELSTVATVQDVSMARSKFLSSGKLFLSVSNLVDAGLTPHFNHVIGLILNFQFLGA